MEKFPYHDTKMYILQQRIKHIKIKLKGWNKKKFGNIFKAKKELEHQI